METELFAAFILFLLFLLVYTIIAEVFVTLFRFTGLSEEKSRFQVISLLTNSGYTTRESERVLRTKSRRKIARATMMFGYAFTVTIVASVVNIFIQVKSIEKISSIYAIPFLIVTVLIAFLLRRNKLIRRNFNNLIEKTTKKFVFKNTINPVIIVDDYDEYVIAEIEIKKMPPIFKDKNLIESEIKQKHNINVLLIRCSEKIERFVEPNDIVRLGDRVIVMGRENDIRMILGGKQKEKSQYV